MDPPLRLGGEEEEGEEDDAGRGRKMSLGWGLSESVNDPSISS